MKNLLIFALTLITTSVVAQLQSVSLHNRYNEDDNTYTVVMVVNEGSAEGNQHRAQFNSQISIVTPTASLLEIIASHNPLQGNFPVNTGTTPLTWAITTMIEAPGITPDLNYYSITPTLSPTARYQNLVAGDCVDLFTYQVSDCTDDCARLWLNGSDPTSQQSGFHGADFSVIMTIGSVDNIFEGILDAPSCPIASSTSNLTASSEIYPNPATDHISITNTAGIVEVRIANMQGQVVSSMTVAGQQEYLADIAHLPTGIYTISIRTNSGTEEHLLTVQ